MELMKALGGSEKFTLKILVPESKCGGNVDMVSIVIGKGGFMIKQLQSRTRTSIYIESYKASESAWSCAQITGEMRDIAEAVKLIYKIIEGKSSFAAFNAKVKAAVLPYLQILG
eukprot:TRINITY_DN14221_c0_g1_i4.p2 TRINITY_DN14221_c0_g1~~TRINITY_DN14221_c0_g1_i4.p2  ORF type:complete len:114 (+),score=21.69 TRINITY_DN14221_c0_g1_i4:454-795(+)